MILFLTMCHGMQVQTGAICTGGHRLPLIQATKLIEAHAKDEILVNQVKSCHVSFSLDASSLDKLMQAGVVTTASCDGSSEQVWSLGG
jgi:hypothetical protein